MSFFFSYKNREHEVECFSNIERNKSEKTPQTHGGELPPERCLDPQQILCE